MEWSTQMLNSFRKWWQRAPAAQTQPLRRVQAAARGSEQLPAPITFGQLRLGAAQSSGLQRTSNEDALFANVEILGTAGSPAQTGLFVVADGVGGHRHGAQASALAVQTVAQAVVPALLAAQAGGGGVQSFDFQASLSAALRAANMAVFAAYPGSGTTVIAALVTGGRLHLAHVGDSRAMLVEAHGMRALTEDHTLVRRLQTAGHITAEQAAVHPQRSTLLRAVGQGEGLQEIGCRDDTGDVVVRIDPRYFRPAEVETLLGDPTRAKEKLGWTPTTTLEELVAEMVAADREDAKKEAYLKRKGFVVVGSMENPPTNPEATKPAGGAA